MTPRFGIERASALPWASSFVDARQGKLRSYLRAVHPFGLAIALAALPYLVGVTPRVAITIVVAFLPMLPMLLFVPERRLVAVLGTLDLSLVLFFGLVLPEMWLILIICAISVAALGWVEGPWHTAYLSVLAAIVVGVVTYTARVDSWPIVTLALVLQSVAVSTTALWTISSRTHGIRRVTDSLSSLSIVMWEADYDGTIKEVAGQVEELYGTSATVAIGRNLSDAMSNPEDFEAWRAAAHSAGAATPTSFVHSMPGPRPTTVRTTVQPVETSDGLRLKGITIDISHQWATGAQQRQMASIVDHMSDGLLLLDTRRLAPELMRMNEPARRFLGVDRDDDCQESFDQLQALHPRLSPTMEAAFERDEEQLLLVHTTDGDRWLVVDCYDIDANTRAVQLTDATDRKMAQDRAEHEARTDPLTGIPNRGELERQLELRLNSAARNVTVFLLDLDRFKPVNDQFGHRTGDVVLRTVARRVAGTLKDGDIVGRLGGDEFGGLITGHLTLTEQLAIRERLEAACSEPIDVDGRRVSVGASVGFALSNGSADMDALFDAADQAMYVEKAQRASLSRDQSPSNRASDTTPRDAGEVNPNPA